MAAPLEMERVGDRVGKGEALCEVETERVTNEVEAPESGTLEYGPRRTMREGAVASWRRESMSFLFSKGSSTERQTRQQAWS